MNAPEGWKLLKDTTQDERSYPEDASHENGNYYNCCVHCLRTFVGHKRRHICKVCALSSDGRASPPETPEQYQTCLRTLKPPFWLNCQTEAEFKEALDSGLYLGRKLYSSPPETAEPRMVKVVFTGKMKPRTYPLDDESPPETAGECWLAFDHAPRPPRLFRTKAEARAFIATENGMSYPHRLSEWLAAAPLSASPPETPVPQNLDDVIQEVTDIDGEFLRYGPVPQSEPVGETRRLCAFGSSLAWESDPGFNEYVTAVPQEVADAFNALLAQAPPQSEPVAWRYRFHTDDSLAGKPNVRRWVLTDSRPSHLAHDQEQEIECEPLYAAPRRGSDPQMKKEKP